MNVQAGEYTEEVEESMPERPCSHSLPCVSFTLYLYNKPVNVTFPPEFYQPF